MARDRAKVNVNSKRLYAKRRAKGLCTKCGEKAVRGKAHCADCQLYFRQLANKALKRKRAAGVCHRCGGVKHTKNHCVLCAEELNQYHLAQRAKRVSAVLDHYGRYCVCCGESILQFLTIDHVNDDGKLHRVRSDVYTTLYQEFKRTGKWRKDCRVLCYNCNSGRWRNGGICPHEEGRCRKKGSRKTELSRS